MEKALEELKKKVLKDKIITKFLGEHKVDEETFERNISILYQQQQANEICNSCQGKKMCQMEVYLMTSVLEYHRGNINLKLVKCPYLNTINEDLLEMMFFPENSQGGELYNSIKERVEVYNAVKTFYNNPMNSKGIYLHGMFGTGKTFILLTLARELTKKNIKVIYAYYPDLVRHIKSSFGNNSLEYIVNKLKTIDVLMLDDIGGENNTAFIRDEVLGPVLQYRMLGKLPTFMTSNYNIDLLRNHLRETKDDIDMIKSDRIIERITYMMQVIELKGDNLRGKENFVDI